MSSSRIVGVCSQIDWTGPGLILESEEFVCRPVDSVDFELLTVTECRDSEWEDCGWELLGGLGDLIGGDAEVQTLREVLSSESTHDHDVVSVILSGTESLSGGDAVGVSLWVLDLDHLPSSVQVLNRMLDVDSLHSGHVPTSRV